MSVEEKDREEHVDEEEEGVSEEEEKDIEDLNRVLSIVADFLNQLKDMVKEFIDMFASSLDGSKLGREVAGMYKSLVEAGMPPDKAMEFTEKFFNAKLEAAPKMSKLIEQLQEMFSGFMSGRKWKTPWGVVEGPGEEFKVKVEGGEKEGEQGGEEAPGQEEENKEKKD
jgi:hypothetical protein